MADTPDTQRPDRRITVYLSTAAWDALRRLAGDDGKLSPVINRLILDADAARESAKPQNDQAGQ